jgi:hypothetical protein
MTAEALGAPVAGSASAASVQLRVARSEAEFQLAKSLAVAMLAGKSTLPLPFDALSALSTPAR